MYSDNPFYNLSNQNMSFDDVISKIRTFIKKDPSNPYRLSIGTDSHVHRDYTRFITAIHIHRVGKGAWGCIRNYTEKRKIKSLREKISMETALTQEVAYRFTDGHFEELAELIIPHENDGASLSLEIHLDIGRKGLTKHLISDMTHRFDAMNIDIKIKPDSYAASSYAHRYTK